MRAVLQRVKSASVLVGAETVGAIQSGLLIFVGVHKEDAPDDVDWMAGKILALRMFEDTEGKSNLSVVDIKGALLVVSQFTLLGDVRKGTRPSFSDSAPPEAAEKLYEDLTAKLRLSGLTVETGRFRAMMDVHIHNWGPYTILLDSQKQF